MLEGLDGKAANEAGIITLDRLRIYVEGQLGKQKSNFFAAGASQIEKIKIAKDPKLHDVYVQKNIEEAESLYANLSMASLIKAIETTKKVLDINTKNQKALELKDKICDSLKKYQDVVGKWKVIYEQDIQPSIPNAFPKIEKLDSYLDFDKIVTLDIERRALLILLCRVSNNEGIDKDEFIKRCKQAGYDNPSSSSTQVAGVHK